MTRTNGSGAAQPRTTLQFYGQAQGVKVNVAKGGYGDDTGSIDITFRVKAPKKPSDPDRYGGNHYEINRAQMVLDRFGGERPDPKENKPGAAEFDRATKAIETATKAQRVRQQRYLRELAAHAPALMAYAQLVGLMAVFSDQRLEITLAPADQDLLPGMGVTLALPKGKDEDDEDEDEADLEDYEEDLDDESTAEMAAEA